MSLQEIADHLGAPVEGDGAVRISGLAGLLDAEAGELSFVAEERYRRHLERTRATAVLVGPALGPVGLPCIRVADPMAAVEGLVPLFRPAPESFEPGVRAGAHVEEGATIAPDAVVLAGATVRKGARIGARSVLHPGTCVGRDAHVGEGCVLHPNVTVGDRVRLGDRVVVHPGSVIGGEGFGYRPGPKGIEKLDQIGTVWVDDDVEIGSLVAIDRARFGRTRIGRGSKIDNLVQIAHNVQIGPFSIVVSQTGISGSARVGAGCVIGGQAGVVGHVEIGDGSRVAARSGISKDVAPGSTVYGFVARSHLEKKREEAALRKLPGLLQRVRELEAKVEEVQRRGADDA